MLWNELLMQWNYLLHQKMAQWNKRGYVYIVNMGFLFIYLLNIVMDLMSEWTGSDQRHHQRKMLLLSLPWTVGECTEIAYLHEKKEYHR